MSQSIDKIFKQIQKESEQIAKQAMIQVKNEIFELVKKEAQTCLKRYYAYKPKIYKRTYKLKNALQFAATDDSKIWKQGSFMILLRYDSSRIEGMHKSRSKFHKTGNKWISRFDDPEGFNFNKNSNGVPEGNNGIPEAGWILKNYMKGVHPGAPWANDTIDNENTDEHMTDFFDKTLPGVVSDIAVKAMQNAVINYITK